MKLNPSDSLKHQLKNAFSISQSPIWQDFSTEKQCRELENVLGGPENLLKITGSRAYERFTGAQILKVKIRCNILLQWVVINEPFR